MIRIFRFVNFIFVFYYFITYFQDFLVDATKCGIKACHKTDPNKLNVHLVPHTHDDVGWLKTVDQYYYGSNKHQAQPGVQYILDSVVPELLKNTDRRFVYVETAFFWRWWEDLQDSEKKIFKTLVSEGRFEFLHGGWCMSDEATPHYSAMIDQMTLGLKFLNETFGECGRPTVSWQIDPFGHSSEVAIEFAQMAFNALFVGRIDYEDHKARKLNKRMEMVWRPDPSVGEAGNLFTSVLFDSYSAPIGFCFDLVSCSDDPIIDNKNLHGYNVDEKIEKFEEHLVRYKAAYNTNHVLVTMGDDFTYSVASSWFKNIDKLIKYTNAKLSSLNLIYSTPNCYIQALNALNLTWPVKEEDDFFPYGSDAHSYWTGYFTSRVALKNFAYKTNNILQGTKQLANLLGDLYQEEEFHFKRAVAIVQHHDGVSGTERQHVANDYATYLQEGLNVGETIFNQAFRIIYDSNYPEHHFCTLTNISQCSTSEDSENFVITLYNPLSRKISIPIRFPVKNNTQHRLLYQNGSLVNHDLIPIPKSVTEIPGRKSNATHEIVFFSEKIPALSTINYYVQVTPSESTTSVNNSQSSENNLILDNGVIQLLFNRSDGMITNLIKDGTTVPFQQNFYYYNAKKGFNGNAETRASGAYIFRPTEKIPKPVALTANITEYKGTHVFEVRQQFEPWLSQVVRLYAGVEDIEFEWLIGPIPIVGWNGIEIVTKYTTNIASNSTFYTDSNGRRWMKRIRNHRKYWNLTITEPVSCNYYPLTTSMCIKDNEKQLTVITDRPEGGTSMNDGELEIMLHRRLVYDDSKGVSEPLDEIAFGEGLVARGKHTIQLNSLNSAADAHRFKVVESIFHPIQTFAKTTYKLSEWTQRYNKIVSLLSSELPSNVQILTFERWRENQMLLRLEHLFQSDENSKYAQPVTLHIKELFSFLEVTNVEELTLAANFKKNDIERLKWNYEGLLPSNATKNEQDDPSKLVLEPMQIRTFLLSVKKLST